MQTLVVDMDGTLIRSDTTHELLLLCARWAPWLLIPALIMLLRDKAKGKRWLSERFGQHIEPKQLPYEPEVLAVIEDYRDKGHAVELVSGSDQTIVERVAAHLGVFDHAIGTTPETNLTSARKAAFLTDRHGKAFRYLGNSRDDLAVWRESSGGYGIRAPKSAYGLVDGQGAPVPVEALVERRPSVRPLLKIMRLHQWAKNVLLFFVPGLFITQLTAGDIVSVLLGFIAFGMMASGTYILNDLFDIPDDRAHRTKKRRPLAAATLSVPAAFAAMVLLISASLGLAGFVGVPFLSILLLYAFTTIAYSFRLKRVPVFDVLILAGLFTIRVVAGAVIIAQMPTAWLVSFVGFLFLSLALAKRYVEVSKLAASGRVSGRGYRAGDGPFVMTFGAATGLAAILSIVIYGLLAENRALEEPLVILAISMLILSWVMRLWMTAARGELDDDPVVFAVKDPASLVTMAMIGALILLDATNGVWHRLF